MVALYRIDKNVPVPPHSRNGRESSTKTLTVQTLKVGESFFLPKQAHQRKASDVSKELSSSASYVSKKFPGRKFIVRSKKEQRQIGARVWRIS